MRATNFLALSLVTASSSAWLSSPFHQHRVLSLKSSPSPEVDIQAKIERALGAVDRLKGTNYASTQGTTKVRSFCSSCVTRNLAYVRDFNCFEFACASYSRHILDIFFE
jgi:hypothetical protein